MIYKEFDIETLKDSDDCLSNKQMIKWLGFRRILSIGNTFNNTIILENNYMRIRIEVDSKKSSENILENIKIYMDGKLVLDKTIDMISKDYFKDSELYPFLKMNERMVKIDSI